LGLFFAGIFGKMLLEEVNVCVLDYPRKPPALPGDWQSLTVPYGN
jgi:hypothetical protein